MSEKNLFTSLKFFSQIETEYGKGAWSGNTYRDVVAFPGDGEITTHKNNCGHFETVQWMENSRRCRKP